MNVGAVGGAAMGGGGAMGGSAMEGGNLMQNPLVKELIICEVCSGLLSDPRVLPCQHSFCLKCVESLHNLRQADSHMKLGSLRCPTCRAIAAIPLGGIGHFPCDKKVDKVRDLVDELLIQSIINKSIKEDVHDCRSSNSSSPADFPGNHGHHNNGPPDFHPHGNLMDDVYGSRTSVYSSTSSLNVPRSTMQTQTDVSWEDLTKINGHQSSEDPSPRRRRRRRPKAEVAESSADATCTTNGEAGMGDIKEVGVEEEREQEQEAVQVEVEQDGQTMEDGQPMEEQDSAPAGTYRLSPIWEASADDYNMPTSISFTSTGTAVVAEYGASQIQFFDSEGTLIQAIVDVKPFSVHVDPEDRILVADRRDKTLRVFDTQGEPIHQWEMDQFKWISGIAVNSAWKYVICEREKCKIGIYEPDGQLIREFGSHGQNDTQFSMADFLTVDSHDRIILCDSANHCVKVYSTEGKFLTKFGQRGTRGGELEWPKSVCVDHRDNVLVTDQRNNRVAMFSPDGEFIDNILTGYPQPYGIAFSHGDPNLIGLTHYSLKGQSIITVFGGKGTGDMQEDEHEEEREEEGEVKENGEEEM